MVAIVTLKCLKGRYSYHSMVARVGIEPTMFQAYEACHPTKGSPTHESLRVESNHQPSPYEGAAPPLSYATLSDSKPGSRSNMRSDLTACPAGPTRM